jgi:D-alanyl-D-alanine carboxypeptidase/D-alanyl-D-alanine-endopeptidase (penicillin-binding protein 4)
MKSKIVIRIRQLFILNAALLTLLASCSIEKQIARSAKAEVLDAKALQTAHVGISIFEPATNKYLYNYQGDKYFVPASNTKIPTCYAAMKYLGDSLVGLRYQLQGDLISVQPSGDPTFLHPDFKEQPVYSFLKGQKNNINFFDIAATTGLGNGWSWNDYDQYYMTERSTMPIYGNLVRFKTGSAIASNEDSIPPFHIEISPGYFKDKTQIGNAGWQKAKGINVIRSYGNNTFVILSNGSSKNVEMPFTETRTIIYKLLSDTIHTMVLPFGMNKKRFPSTIHSQPTDSLLKPMMHRSDNFFAEQSLLMVSNEMLGIMNDEKIIDTLLKTDFKDLPQKPRWADGSGLSRYNLFTPQDFVSILNKMKNEFGMERIKVILPTGGEGTISSYYKADSGYIYGKTGTLSGVVAFSGYLYTKKGKLLIFSTLINNHQASATEVRKAIEKFLQGVRNKY